MGTKTTLKSLSHGVHNLNYHLVVVTKYRRKVITKAMLTGLKEIFSNVCTAWRCELVEFNEEADHVHLLISAIPI
jgi:putative transposase